MASRTETEAAIINDHGLLAKPLHLQRLEQSVRLGPFFDYVHNVFIGSQSDIDAIEEGSRSDVDLDEDAIRERYSYEQERRCDRLRLYNFSKVKKSRMWLKDILLSDSSNSDDSSESITEGDCQNMLKLHKMHKAASSEFKKNPELQQYQYYGTGLLSNFDKFYDHQKLVMGGKKIKEKKIEKRKAKLKKVKSEGSKEDPEGASGGRKAEGKSRKSDASHHTKKKNWASHEAAMNMKRRRLWVAIGKKEIGRGQKQLVSGHRETVGAAKKLAQACQREVRRSALLSQKLSKELGGRGRRLTKEMLLYWKRYDKVEKEHRKRAEKEAQEQLRMDIELREAKRQQRKLNFLITQTELYAHFMSRKVNHDHILQQLDEPKVPSSLLDDQYNADEMKALALKNADAAYKAHLAKTTAFDAVLPKKRPLELDDNASGLAVEHPQPSMFVGKLKSYQLKGMNWLYSLYDKGINGILADEMGLGKTVQTIAFLATLVRAQGVWGPFLVIAPASTLHNWQQELTRFVPALKVLPYWGNPGDRRVLRKFWSQKDLHTEQASFHVLVTSYQLVVQDVKYFQRVKWQYMVLDEAQAIKSSSSTRWKILLGFNCRNRLLLTGTPIQNSMAELWALLHFIMPTLFDCHLEFNEWFSKDIESHAESRAPLDHKHLSRLHQILQPFMLRRVKRDVENELSDKIEILVYCPLTQRQRLLYQGLKNKISIDDLLQAAPSSSLMNLVMQFRKVCNHPDLFERREVKSPFLMPPLAYALPKLLFRDPPRRTPLFLFHPHHIHRSSCFSFLRFIDVSPGELHQLFMKGLLTRLVSAYLSWKSAYRIRHRWTWGEGTTSRFLSRRDMILSPLQPPSAFLFASHVGHVYGFVNHFIYRKQKMEPKTISISANQNVCHPVSVYPCQLASPPSFLTQVSTKVVAQPLEVYCVDAQWRQQKASREALDFLQCGDPAPSLFHSSPPGGLAACRPPNGWAKILIPSKETLVSDACKLQVLDELLGKLKAQGHRVLIYSQMTRMIDLLEEYACYRQHTYMRLDGSSKIADRRDMVADFQARADIFVFLLSTRAGGLGINLTAADTVIFYDSDWNPTVDQQAMDRAHRLGQTKQVTVYRLVCKGSIEERILQRARQKSEIQRMVISGGNFKPDTLKPKEVVSLLLDDDELERKFRVRQEERKLMERTSQERKRDSFGESKRGRKKRTKEEGDGDSLQSVDLNEDDTSSEGPLVVDDGSPSTTPLQFIGNHDDPKKRGSGRGRGRPRGSSRRGNGRGRGLAAAELAGKSAAYAAYGYALNAGKTSEGNHPSAPTLEKTVFRGQRSNFRKVSNILPAKCFPSSRGRSAYKGLNPNLPTQSISLGFYMPQLP